MNDSGKVNQMVLAKAERYADFVVQLWSEVQHVTPTCSESKVNCHTREDCISERSGMCSVPSEPLAEHTSDIEDVYSFDLSKIKLSESPATDVAEVDASARADIFHGGSADEQDSHFINIVEAQENAQSTAQKLARRTRRWSMPARGLGEVSSEEDCPPPLGWKMDGLRLLAAENRQLRASNAMLQSKIGQVLGDPADCSHRSSDPQTGHV